MSLKKSRQFDEKFCSRVDTGLMGLILSSLVESKEEATRVLDHCTELAPGSLHVLIIIER